MTSLQIVSPTLSAIIFVYRTLNISIPEPTEVPGDEWKEFEVIMSLRKLNKFLSLGVLAGTAGIVILFFDMSDQRAEWAK